MTRSEFLEDITDFGDLKNFCDSNGIDICDYVMDGEYFDEIIMERIRERDYFENWQDVYRFLRDLPDGAAYYIEDDCGGFNEAFDDDFEEHKQWVLEYIDERGEWDSEDDEEGVEEETAGDNYIPIHRPVEKEEPEDMEITAEEFYMMIGKAG